MRGDPDEFPPAFDRPADTLMDPPDGIRAEGGPALGIEPVNGFDEAEHPLLHQILKVDPASRVPQSDSIY